MNEDQYISYFTSLAKSHAKLRHGIDGMFSFAYIEDEFNMQEFDNALKNMKSSTCMLLVSEDGEFDDAGSENYNDLIEGSLFILGRVSDNADNIRRARAKCKPIIMQMLKKMRKDSRANNIVAGKKIHFRLEGLKYNHVGPMNNEWYGYMVTFRFVCPFANDVETGIWL
jgi:hypothetical protein